MKKIVFFGIASISVHKTLLPILNELASNNYKLVYYNVKSLEPDSSFFGDFIPYPDDFEGHYANKFGANTSYFEFGEILLDMAIQLVDFLEVEVDRENPDLIIHSHLAIWGKIIAKRFNINHISFFTTFILDKRIILPYFKKFSEEKNGAPINNIDSALRFNKKSKLIKKKLGLDYQIDFWDTLVNSGDLNLSFILKCLQPKVEVLSDNFKFLGYPMPVLTTNGEEQDRNIIYVSMGTLTKTELSLYQTFIDVLKELKIRCIISLGSKTDASQFRDVPENVEIKKFVNQKEVLKKCLLFITHGGMASVQESIYSITPMIIVPIIPEQKITADTINRLNTGIHLPLEQLKKETLQAAIQTILDHRSVYTKNLMDITSEISSQSPQDLALNSINNFFANLS